MAQTSKRIFVLTGAGISAESGLGTFRDRGGLWGRHDPMALATPEAFARDPDTVLDFYNFRWRGVVAAEPNAAHLALARAEMRMRETGGRLFLCTQNVDDLHERAGAEQVVHMHGEILKVRCTACGGTFERRTDVVREDACPACNQRASLRPDVVWFGEMPNHLDAIDAALRGSDLFVAVGTSGSVYPAAGYVAQARALGIRTCEINLAPSDTAGLFDEARYGPATESVPNFFDGIIAYKNLL